MQRPPGHGSPSPSRSRALLLAALASAVLWISTVAAAGLGLGGTLLVTLGAAGLAMTLALLLALNRQHSELRDLAATDALTGLANHRGFHERLHVELGAARRAHQPLSLVMLDLDNFKAVNDRHGYPYGDEVLHAVGWSLRRAIRTSDTAARTGGEEFGLILPAADADGAYAIAERARAAVAAVNVHGFELSCSAGIAAYPADAGDAPSLCQLADSALHWAKHSGKRRTRHFDPEQSPTAWTDSQTAEIESLLVRPGSVWPLYQPVVALPTGALVGYEALARFPGAPERSPAIWFAQAHGCGLGPELEATAIRAALEPLGRPYGTHLALNVSPSALSSQAVREALPDDLSEIVIEITEHEFISDEDNTLAATVAELRERGAKIAIDDAGAGHAGLAQLMRVRPDIVKLDRALIDAIRVDPPRMALVESFVRFARNVGATVCAEGIESLDDLAVLADLDVEWGQGFALARPAPPWAKVSPIATDVCRSALAESLGGLAAEGTASWSDRRLVDLSARLAGARSRADLERAMALISEELRASKVCVSSWDPVAEVIETLAENGESSGETRFRAGDYPLSVQVVREQRVRQVVVGDPESDPAEASLLLELGERSLLMLPVVNRGESIGLLEAFSAVERPWTRTEVNRARLIANQFASVIPGLSGAARWDPSERRA